MPPKRKQPDAQPAEVAPTTRASRASARTKTREETPAPPPPKKRAPAKKAAAKPVDKGDSGEDTQPPPAKKPRTAAKPKRSKQADDTSANTNGETSKPAEPPAEPKLEPKKATVAKKHEPYSPKAAAALFATYADADDSTLIGPEGFESLCTDADFPMDGPLPVLLSWQLKSEEMGKFELDKWEKWTTTHKISSLSAVKTYLEELDDLLFQGKPPVKPSKKPDEPYDRTTYFQYAAAPKEAFQSLYAFCFIFTKPPASRNIDMDTAKAFWTLLLVPKYTLMAEILEFITAHEDSYKAVNKDLWSMMLEFLEAVGPNLDGYDEEAAWPTLVDEFVASKKGQD